MGWSCLLLVFILWQLMAPSEAAAAISMSGGVGINIGGGGGGDSTPAGPGSKLTSAYTALQAWKSAITDDPLGVLKTWDGLDLCSYKGVFCSYGNGPSVIAIDLNHANLQGTIPDTFKDLSSLQELDLSGNYFSGPFPMVTLYMPNLVYLDLRFNTFSGPIPEDLFNKRLDAIFLNNNQFEGELPANLGNSPASVINLANNKLNGNIPSSFGFTSSRLKEILLLNNQLTGCIPQGVGVLFSEMQVFDVSQNSLMGHLPDTMSCLSDIEVLNLAHNQLSGLLPDIVCSLRSLVNLTVAYNFFSGFGQECSKSFLRDVGFDFSLNCIPGRDMQRPRPECSFVPGSGLSCLRIPSPQPLVCGELSRNLKANQTSTSPFP
ncbi:hypothetical protein like AT4G29240 [Hibiscus trionum]|uniref:Cell wall hydroxyproline-rich glycoprotein n=1 Tax=Hibiscus trionum TaxID=183268 RepID=A0A9W7HX39_HIBTR|nr:hypothetical protein like AT4G29240 [Hibiscus trionum]